MLTKEVAQAAGVTAETVRFYTRKGLLPAQKNPHNGYHIYSPQVVNRLRFITHARTIGFSLREIEDIIRCSEQGQTPCCQVRSMLKEKIEEAQKTILEYQRHLKLMEATYAQWQQQPDGLSPESSLCHLIENWPNTVSGSHEVHNED